MALLIYCDNNFIISAHDGPQEYKDRLRGLSSSGAVRFVLSPWHWHEMARDRNHVRGTSMADFCDTLNPAWLYERRSIQKREAAAAFYRFAKIPTETLKVLGDISDVIYDLIHTRADRRSRDFVEHLRQLNLDHPMERALKRAPEINAKNTRDFLAGKFSKKFLTKCERLYVQTLLPLTTPAGIAIDEGTKWCFLDLYSLNELPCTAPEWNITHETWAFSRTPNENNIMDSQHVSAVPYVDLLVTDDNKISNLIKRAVRGVPFRTAEVMTKSEFDARFPMV